MIDTLLIANRGEIACRVIETAQRMGLRTVAVYSEADRDAIHVRQADEAIFIGEAPARESYLRADRVIAAAKSCGAQAIHPGYGFLSENADFAEACENENLIFIGPPAEAIRAMGLKAEAKRRMEAAGIPVIPGEHSEADDDISLSKAAERIGYPLLVKAIAGGGGKGMRRVDSQEDLAAALQAARHEAESSFGDNRLLIEKWLGRSRHIEVQVFADSQGDVVHLFERDCSVQRRHQKVVEEAPAPNMPESLRQAMCEAAISATRAINYRGAGTIEFLVDISQGIDNAPFYFMEMNTRLQVEHRVTEAITGVDLVEWQIRVAAGEPLPLKQEDLSIQGHSVEVRVYAEDPARRYLPQTGTLVRHRPPATNENIKVDNSVDEGDSVTIHYDPMISKLITHHKTREDTLRHLGSALEQYQIAGVTTNLSLLHSIARHPSFLASSVDTSFLTEHEATLVSGESRFEEELIALACSTFLEQRKAASYPLESADKFSPWAKTDCFRLNDDGFEVLHFKNKKDDIDIRTHFTKDAITLAFGDGAFVVRDIDVRDNKVSATINGVQIEAFYARQEDRFFLMRNASHLTLNIRKEKAFTDIESSAEGKIRAPMPGKVTSVSVQNDQKVKRGQALLTLEAMKMEHTLKAPLDGTVTHFKAEIGQQVEENEVLLIVE